MLALRNANLRKLKSSCEKLDASLSSANSYLPKLTDKGVPQAMVGFYGKKINPIKEYVSAKLDYWSTEAKASPETDPDEIDAVKVVLSFLWGPLFDS